MMCGGYRDVMAGAAARVFLTDAGRDVAVCGMRGSAWEAVYRCCRDCDGVAAVARPERAVHSSMAHSTPRAARPSKLAAMPAVSPTPWGYGGGSPGNPRPESFKA
ncbi:hypothetical protein [Rahnella sp. ChDrAdgB13]|uniref:hypothetical protein n=1 Tax=Rahnella sp. ChDrAdgB13 TaxID=1850581 RepID=UPI001AD886A7|nr:hypothetical protein [Rahnella sp. ChDrAdgB13]